MPVQERGTDQERRRLALRVWKVIWDDIKDRPPDFQRKGRYFYRLDEPVVSTLDRLVPTKKQGKYPLGYIVFVKKRSNQRAAYYNDISLFDRVPGKFAGIVFSVRAGIPDSWKKDRSVAIHELTHWIDYARVNNPRKTLSKGDIYYGKGKEASYLSNPTEVDAFLTQALDYHRKALRKAYSLKRVKVLQDEVEAIRKTKDALVSKGADARVEWWPGYLQRLVKAVRATKEVRPDVYRKVIVRVVEALDDLIKSGERLLKRRLEQEKEKKVERKSDDQYLRLANKAWKRLYDYLKGVKDYTSSESDPVVVIAVPKSLSREFDQRKDGLKYIIFSPKVYHTALASYGTDATAFGNVVGIPRLSGPYIVISVPAAPETSQEEIFRAGLKMWKSRKGVIIHEITHWLKEVNIPAYSDYMAKYKKQRRLKHVAKNQRIDREYWARAQETEINAYLLGLVSELRDKIANRIKVGDWDTIEYLLDWIMEPALKNPAMVWSKYRYNTLKGLVPEMLAFMDTLMVIKKRRPKVYPKVVKRAKEQVARIRRAVEQAKKRAARKEPVPVVASLNAVPSGDPILEASPYPLEENASVNTVPDPLTEACSRMGSSWTRQVLDVLSERYGGATKERGIWFHGTSSDILTAIKSKGLDPYPKVKGFGSSLGGRFDRPSFLSFGGSYLTSNLRDAITAAKWVAENRGGRPVLVCADIQPRSLVADEDDITGIVREMPTGMPGISYGYDQSAALYFALKYGIGKDMVRTAFSEWMNIAFRRILRKAAGQEKRLATVLKKNRRRVMEALELIWRAEVERRAAYIKDWFSKPGHDIYQAVLPFFGEEAKRLEGKDLLSKLPSKDSAERKLQKEVDSLTRIFKDLARPWIRGGPAKGRALQPIGWKGKNKVVCLLEIVPDEHGVDTIKVIKGKVPQEFVKQWKAIYGDFRKA